MNAELVPTKDGLFQMSLGTLEQILFSNLHQVLPDLPQVNVLPFPHLGVQNALSLVDLAELEKNWPEETWNQEVPGNFTYQPFQEPKCKKGHEESKK